ERASVWQSVENRQTVAVAGHRLAIYQTRFTAQEVDGHGDQREASSPIIAVAGEKPDAGRVSARHHAEAVVLDLVNPVRAGGRLSGRRREAGLDKNGKGGGDGAFG